MKPPKKRPDVPPRRSDNDKRRLEQGVTDAEVRARYPNAWYRGSPKHKRNPHLFGLEPFTGPRGDATLCDEHAAFSPQDMERVPKLLRRGLDAKLVGTRIWTVDDTGWIFELAVTNATSGEHHGYPVRASEAIAAIVFRAFRDWAAQHGTDEDRGAALACQNLYGFAP